MNKILFIPIIFFILSSCSYEPIFSNKKYDFQFVEIVKEGNKNINELVTDNLLRKGNGNKKYKINIKSKKYKEIVSTNEKGDPIVFKIQIEINYKLFDDNLILLNKDIIKQTTYNNINDKLELIKYEENIINNLAYSISTEILMSVTILSK